MDICRWMNMCTRKQIDGGTRGQIYHRTDVNQDSLDSE